MESVARSKTEPWQMGLAFVKWHYQDLRINYSVRIVNGRCGSKFQIEIRRSFEETKESQFESYTHIDIMGHQIKTVDCCRRVDE